MTISSLPSVQFGASHFDVDTGLRVFCLHPKLHPTMWERYICGALERYGDYGYDGLLDEELRSGSTTDVFSLLMDGDTPVGGVRTRLLREVGASTSLKQFEGHPLLPRLRAKVSSYLDDGIVEGMTLWTSRDAPPKSATLAGNCHFVAARALGVRWSLGTADERFIDIWLKSGAEIVDHGIPSYWPTPDNATRLVRFDIRNLAERVAPDVYRQYDAIWSGYQTLSIAALNETGAAVQKSNTGEPTEDEMYACEVIDERTPDGGLRIRLLALDRSVRLIDHYEALCPELAPLGIVAPPESSGRWIYYPWRAVAVRTLGPVEFMALRLDRNRNKITPEEQNKLSRLRIGVVGLSVGQVIAHTLALEGLAGELRLADFDTLELSNLNRIPTSTLDLGLNKAVSAARRIAELDPYLQISVHTDGVTSDNVNEFLDGLDLVIEECDSLDMKLLVREEARRRGIPVIMSTSDRGLLDVERFDLEPDRPLIHGLAGSIDASELAGLTTSEKVEFALKITEPAALSSRAAASMMEIGHELATWPQLGGDVVHGAALVVAAVRRLGLGQPLRSGRVRADIAIALDDLEEPTDHRHPDAPTPIEQPPEELLSRLAWFAGRAPSGGNVQPWRFSTDGSSLMISADYSKSVTMDIGHRGTHVAVGAALFNARVAASEAGVLGPHELFPSPAEPALVARLELGDHLDIGLVALAGHVGHRATDRRTDRRVPLKSRTIDALRNAVEAEGAHLSVLTDDDVLERAGELLGRADRLRFLSPRLHAEMISELRWPEDGPAYEGIEVGSLGLDETGLLALSLFRRADVMAALRSWGGGAALAEPAAKAISASSALLMVNVDGIQPEDYVRGGCALQRMWLEAHGLGLGLQPWAPPFLYASEPSHHGLLVAEEFVDESRVLAEELWKLFSISGRRHPVLILRAGIVAGDSPLTPRRPITLNALDSSAVRHETSIGG